MSPPSDASGITAPKDPEAYRPRPLLGVTFWAMLALMLLCVLAGVAIANFGPSLFEAKPLAGRAVETSPIIAGPSRPALAPKARRRPDGP